FGLALLRVDADYRRFYMARICWQFTAMAFPFYAFYAYNELQLPENLVGLFLSIWMGAGVFSNYVWGRVLDSKGNRVVLLVTAILSVLPPLVVIILEWASARGLSLSSGMLLVILSSTFLINGFIRSGRIISNITYLLEIAPPARRPLYVGFMNSFSFPFMLSPLAAGLVLEVFGIRALFTLCFASALLNVWISFRLREPRSQAN
ncbi:MAG: MFS transporter, partial [Candidatus Krumholzibacteria bacterium]|nr:MFS transporter [Candidatus Krumholzibacteria bacterium]